MKFVNNLFLSIVITLASFQGVAQSIIPDAYRINLKAQNNKYLSATRASGAEVAAIADVPYAQSNYSFFGRRPVPLAKFIIYNHQNRRFGNYRRK
jgi:hypothetical protein